MSLAYRIVRSEHYEINLVMRCLHNLADALHREAWQPDFDLLFLILHSHSLGLPVPGFSKICSKHGDQ